MANSEYRIRGAAIAPPSCSRVAPAICHLLFASALSHPARIEHRLLAGAVALERALLADGVGALENPVLPRGEAREDFRFHGLRPPKRKLASSPVRPSAEKLARSSRNTRISSSQSMSSSAKVTRPSRCAASASSISPVAAFARSRSAGSARKRLASRESPFDIG